MVQALQDLPDYAKNRIKPRISSVPLSKSSALESQEFCKKQLDEHSVIKLQPNKSHGGAEYPKNCQIDQEGGTSTVPITNALPQSYPPGIRKAQISPHCLFFVEDAVSISFPSPAPEVCTTRIRWLPSTSES